MSVYDVRGKTWHTCTGQVSPIFTWVPGVEFRSPCLHSKWHDQLSHHAGPLPLFIYLEMGLTYVALTGLELTEIFCHLSAGIKDVSHHVPCHLYFIHSFIVTGSLPEPGTHLLDQTSQWVLGCLPVSVPHHWGYRSVLLCQACIWVLECQPHPHAYEEGALLTESSPKVPQRQFFVCCIITQSQGCRERRGWNDGRGHDRELNVIFFSCIF